jgi:hypothetical protein
LKEEDIENDAIDMIRIMIEYGERERERGERENIVKRVNVMGVQILYS